MEALILGLLLAVAALLGVVTVLLVLVWRRGEVRQAGVGEALAGTERRLNEGLDALRRGQEQVGALQRQELGATLARQGEVAERQLSAVRDLVSEGVPQQVGRVVDARFQTNFSKVGQLLEELRARFVQLEGLGSGMGALNEGVRRFSQMLGNVKARGTWGEWQLGNVLSDMLAPGQFARNVHPNPRSPSRVVEFAVALPGDDERAQVWLPIDAKFPREDYERLLAAAERGDRAGEEEAAKALVAKVKGFARDVRDRYVVPPYTTDFAILFLPTEGLYLEILRHVAVVDEIQRQQKVLLAGPTTLAALINALQMGFQTLAVKRNTVKVLDALKRVRDGLESFEKQNERLIKALQGSMNAAEQDASRIKTLRVALSKVAFQEAPGESAATGENEDA